MSEAQQATGDRARRRSGRALLQLGLVIAAACGAEGREPPPTPGPGVDQPQGPVRDAAACDLCGRDLTRGSDDCRAQVDACLATLSDYGWFAYCESTGASCMTKAYGAADHCLVECHETRREIEQTVCQGRCVVALLDCRADVYLQAESSGSASSAAWEACWSTFDGTCWPGC